MVPAMTQSHEEDHEHQNKKMKWINPRKTGYYKLFKILNRDTGLKTLLVYVADNKSAHYKKQIHHQVSLFNDKALLRKNKLA